MKTIKELLDIVIALEDESQISKAINFHKGVPTLENGVYKKLSSMLKVRYELFGTCKHILMTMFLLVL